VATWDARGLAPSIHSNNRVNADKTRYLTKLMSNAEVIAIQECHGTIATVQEYVKLFPSWLCFK
jgi:hypothetical protein